MTRQIAVVHEAEADFTTATELADRVVVESISWMTEDDIGPARDWVAFTPDGLRLSWTGIETLAHDAGIRVRGHFGNDPAEPDAKSALRAIRYLRLIYPELDAVMLIRDQDNQPERRLGFEQARAVDHGGLPIVVGVAIVEREAWILCGFHAEDEAETAKIAVTRARLGFDPCVRSHELTAFGDDTAKRSAKRALHELTASAPDRERRCWLDTPLPTLRDRGKDNGLADYLDDVQLRLSPLFGHAA